MKRLLIRLAILTGILAAAVGVRTLSSSADPQPLFTATFDTPGDFFDRFDMGLSGQAPGGIISPLPGDHDTSSTPTTTCGGPTTSRPVSISGADANVDFSQEFWWCAPSGPGSGHIMTGLDTTGYNHLWFAPKPEFTGITKVCWDINETTEGGKWTEVQFVDHADATRYPVGSKIGFATWAHGTGGFDLGFSDPEFSDPAGPSTDVISGGTIAGLTQGFGSIFSWFQNGSFVQQQIGWPGNLPGFDGKTVITDKATRYTSCVENSDASHVTITNNTPYGSRSFTIAGQIPQDARRVVFQDSEYDGPKRGLYDPNAVTWHWDNIQVFAASSTETPPSTTITVAPTTTAPTTTQATTTIASTTTAPSTTIATTTTQASTTTASTTTTLATTTVPPSTTTTLAPLTCPSGFTTSQRNWCLAVNARIAALEQRVAALGG